MGTSKARRTLRAALCAVALAALLAPAPAAWAREGIYAGFGVARAAFTGGITGDQAYPDDPAAPSSEVRVGQPQAATGLAVGGGFGFNDYVALDLQVTLTRHDSRFHPGQPSQQDFAATLSAVQFGVKVGAPIGDVAEVFGRVGLGGYELQYDDNHILLADGSVVSGARFIGRGTTLGVGAELFFGHWGLQLAYGWHDIEFDAVDTESLPGSLAPPLEPSVTTVNLVFVYYLQ